MHGFLALPALQHLIHFQNLKNEKVASLSPLNVCFDVLAGWRVAGLE
jgi:hypothetical protein